MLCFLAQLPAQELSVLASDHQLSLLILPLWSMRVLADKKAKGYTLEVGTGTFFTKGQRGWWMLEDEGMAISPEGEPASGLSGSWLG